MDEANQLGFSCRGGLRVQHYKRTRPEADGDTFAEATREDSTRTSPPTDEMYGKVSTTSILWLCLQEHMAEQSEKFAGTGEQAVERLHEYALLQAECLLDT